MDQRQNFLALILFDALEDENLSDVTSIMKRECIDPSYVPTERGISPLHYACGMDNHDFARDVVGKFLRSGADPNVCTTEENMTPLHIAAMYGRKEIVRMLLENGGKLEVYDDHRMSPVHYAIEENHFDIVQIMREHIYVRKSTLMRKLDSQSCTSQYEGTGRTNSNTHNGTQCRNNRDCNSSHQYESRLYDETDPHSVCRQGSFVGLITTVDSISLNNDNIRKKTHNNTIEIITPPKLNYYRAEDFLHSDAEADISGNSPRLSNVINKNVHLNSQRNVENKRAVSLTYDDAYDRSYKQLMAVANSPTVHKDNYNNADDIYSLAHLVHDYDTLSPRLQNFSKPQQYIVRDAEFYLNPEISHANISYENNRNHHYHFNQSKFNLKNCNCNLNGRLSPSAQDNAQSYKQHYSPRTHNQNIYCSCRLANTYDMDDIDDRLSGGGGLFADSLRYHAARKSNTSCNSSVSSSNHNRYHKSLQLPYTPPSQHVLNASRDQQASTSAIANVATVVDLPKNVVHNNNSRYLHGPSVAMMDVNSAHNFTMPKYLFAENFLDSDNSKLTERNYRDEMVQYEYERELEYERLRRQRDEHNKITQRSSSPRQIHYEISKRYPNYDDERVRESINYRYDARRNHSRQSHRYRNTAPQLHYERSPNRREYNDAEILSNSSRLNSYYDNINYRRSSPRLRGGVSPCRCVNQNRYAYEQEHSMEIALSPSRSFTNRVHFNNTLMLTDTSGNCEYRSDRQTASDDDIIYDQQACIASSPSTLTYESCRSHSDSEQTITKTFRPIRKEIIKVTTDNCGCEPEQHSIVCERYDTDKRKEMALCVRYERSLAENELAAGENKAITEPVSQAINQENDTKINKKMPKQVSEIQPFLVDGLNEYTKGIVEYQEERNVKTMQYNVKRKQPRFIPTPRRNYEMLNNNNNNEENVDQYEEFVEVTDVNANHHLSTDNNKHKSDTPNKLEYNYDVTSPYYINITHRRHKPQPKYPDIVLSAMPDTADEPISNVEEDVYPIENENNNNVEQTPLEAQIVNLFALTKEKIKELTKRESTDRSRASFIETWRNKVQRSRTRQSILKQCNDVDELINSVLENEHLNFTNTVLMDPNDSESNDIEERNNVQEINSNTLVPLKTNVKSPREPSLGKIIQTIAQAQHENQTTADQNREQEANTTNDLTNATNYTDCFLQMKETYFHTDDENGLVFYETKMVVNDSNRTALKKYANPIDIEAAMAEERNYHDTTVTSQSTNYTIPLDYETDALRAELTQYGKPPGPITKTTKRLYIKQLVKCQRRKTNFISDDHQKEEARFSVELIRTLKNEDNFQRIGDYYTYETQSSTYFASHKFKKTLREGHMKKSFIYLLIDPRISVNLPGESPFLEPFETWRRFLHSIFYVGKGKSSRPYSHLYEALKAHTSQQYNKQIVKKTSADKMPINICPKSPISKKTLGSKKIDRIQNIWASGNGVVCLHVFHNIVPAEAYTREAAIIEALGLNHLTNIKRGGYYGPASTWTMKEKKFFGIALLYKAMQIFLAEGESQLLPCDLI